MLNKQEITTILVSALIIGFTLSLVETWTKFGYALLTIFLIFIINITAKKVASFYLDSEIEIKPWEIKHYGFKPHKYFKKDFPAGAFLPIISKVFLFPFRNFIWMASLVFDVKPKKYRAAKRFGLYSFSEMTELHIGLIAAAGIVANIIFAGISYIIGYPEFAKISIYYIFFNMLPISDLDGNKIFFGSLLIWSILASIIMILMLGIIIVA